MIRLPHLARSSAATLAALTLAFTMTACGDDEKDSTGGNSKDGAQDQGSSSTDASPSDGTDSTDSPEGSEGSEGTDGGTEGTDGGTSPAAAEFCSALRDTFVSSSSVSENPTAKEWAAVQETYAALGEVGVPDDAGDDAAKGLDVLVSTVTDLDYAEAKKLFTSSKEPDVTLEEQAQLDALTDYVTGACKDAFSAGQ